MNIPTHGPILPEEVYAASGEVLALEGIEALEGQQPMGASRPIIITNTTRIPTVYWMIVITMGAVIVIGVWKNYLKK